MYKALVILAALMLSLAALYPAGAAQPHSTGVGAATDEDIVGKQRKEYEFKAATNAVFLKAAMKILGEYAGGGALSQLKVAAAAAEEARRHYDAGDYVFALEYISESTRMAQYAIIIAKSDNPSTRELVLKEDLFLSASRDHERKKTMIKRSLLEAETFIKTAERLLVTSGHRGAREKVSKAKELMAESRMAIAADEYDIALSKIHLAYDLSTGAVREIKKSEGALITFPKPVAKGQNKLLAYEKKRNETYLSFTGHDASIYDKESMKMIRRARALSTEAASAHKAGKYGDAITKFNESTKLLIEALKSSNYD
jgi:hypothetical protein